MPWFSQSESEPTPSPNPSLDEFREILAAAQAGLEAVKTSEPVELVDGRAVFVPFLREGEEPKRDHITMEEALKQGMEISELRDQVARLRIHNPLKEKVLGVEGEVLKGCKQNRTLNTTLMVDAKTHLAVPVSCVEQGRWSAPMGHMDKGVSHSPSNVRRAVRESVYKSKKDFGGYESNQGSVWENVQDYSKDAQETSASGNFDEVAEKEQRKPEVSTVYRSLNAAAKGATGYALAVGGNWVSAEMFGHSEDWKILGPSILRGMAGEISRLHLSVAKPDSVHLEEDPRDGLFALLNEKAIATRSPGLGWDLGAKSPDESVHLAALVEANQLRWLSALSR